MDEASGGRKIIYNVRMSLNIKKSQIDQLHNWQFFITNQSRYSKLPVAILALKINREKGHASNHVYIWSHPLYTIYVRCIYVCLFVR